MKNRLELSRMELLPTEVYSHLFNFFNLKELTILSGVNKKFHKKIDELIDKSNIFYTVGKSIRLSDNDGRSFFWDMYPTSTKYREAISLKEIHDSFTDKNITDIRLFKIENEAWDYARSLRKGDDFDNGKDSFQPAVFKVIYVGDTNAFEKKNELLKINLGYGKTYDLRERTSLVIFFEAKREDVIPLEGSLKIEHLGKDSLLNYGMIDYSNLNLTEEKNHLSFKR